MLASPAGLKLAMDAGRPVVGAIQKMGPPAIAALEHSAPAIAGQYVGGNQPAAAPTNAVAPILSQGGPNRSPATGPDAWAQQGHSKLGIQHQGLASRLLSDPKGKQLLIQASDLKPGSAAMKNLMKQIQKRLGAK
jgi:hypothetical protein